jgi:hypothetical protein
MDYQKSLQKPKLGNGEVTSHYSLQKVVHYENPMHQISATEATSQEGDSKYKWIVLVLVITWQIWQFSRKF